MVQEQSSEKGQEPDQKHHRVHRNREKHKHQQRTVPKHTAGRGKDPHMA